LVNFLSTFTTFAFHYNTYDSTNFTTSISLTSRYLDIPSKILDISSAIRDQTITSRSLPKARASTFTNPQQHLRFDNPPPQLPPQTTTSSLNDNLKPNVTMPKTKKKSAMYQALVGDHMKDTPPVIKGTNTTRPDSDEDEDSSVNPTFSAQNLSLFEYFDKVGEKLKRTREDNKNASIEGEVTRRTSAAQDQIRLQFEEQQRTFLAGEAHKEAIAQLKAELRDQVTAEMKAEIFEQLAKDIRHENEEPMKARLEAEIRVQLVEDLLRSIAAELKPEVEKKLKQELEWDVREQLMRELPAKLQGKVEISLKPKIEERLRKEIGAKLEKEQLARADPVSPLVRPEIDGVSYPELKRLSPDDDFERYGKRRRPSYDYDGEHEADHEKRIANVLEQELQQKLQQSVQLILHQEQAGPGRVEREPSESSDQEYGLTGRQIIQREYMQFKTMKKWDRFEETDEDYESDMSDYRGGEQVQTRALKREHSEHSDEEDEYELRKHGRKTSNVNQWDSHRSTGGYFREGERTSGNDEHFDETEGNFGYEDENQERTEDFGQSDDDTIDDDETIDEEQEEIVKEPQTIDLRGTSKEDAILLDSDDDETDEDVALPPMVGIPAALPPAGLRPPRPAYTSMRGPSFQQIVGDEDMSDGYDDDEEDEEIYGAIGGLLDSRGNLKAGDEDDGFDMLNLQGIYDENGDLISKKVTPPSEVEEDPDVRGMDDDQKHEYYSKRRDILEAEYEQIRADLAAKEQAEEEQRILWGASIHGRYADGGKANEAHKPDTPHSANLTEDHDEFRGADDQNKAEKETPVERPKNSRTASIDEDYDNFDGAEDDAEQQRGGQTKRASNLETARSTNFGDDFVKFEDMNDEDNAGDEESEEDDADLTKAEESKPEVDDADEKCVNKGIADLEEGKLAEAALDKADETESDDEADGSEQDDEDLVDGEEGGYEDEDATEEEGYEDEEEIEGGEYEDEVEDELEEDANAHNEDDEDKTLIGLPSPKGPVSAFHPINGSGYKAGFFTPKKGKRDLSNKEISKKMGELEDGRLGVVD